VEMKTEIFISKEKVLDGQTLDLSIIYTPYKGISHSLYIYIEDIKIFEKYIKISKS